MTPDDSLDLPAPPRPPEAVADPQGDLVRAAPAHADPVVCAARRVLVRASGLHGALVAEADGAPLVGRVALDTPPAANMLVTPRSLTREVAGAGGSLRELLLVPERLPGFAIQWTGWSPAQGWPLTVDLLPGSGQRYRAEGPTLRIADAEGGGLLLHLAGAAGAAWHVVEGEGRRLARASVRLHGDAPVTLMVDRVEPGVRLPSLPALGALAAHRRRDELEPGESPGIRLETGVVELDQGVAWARAALRALFEDGPAGTGVRILDALPETGGAAPPGSEAALVALGALAAGEWEVARAAVDRPPLSPVDAEALALWVAWTSKPDPFLGRSETVERLADDHPQPLRKLVADAAEAAGDEALAQRLRQPVARAGAGGRRLPTVGRAEPQRPDESAGSDADPHPLDHYRRGDDEAGFALLRRLLARMLREGPDPGGLQAAMALDTLVRGLLGVAPDAGYGRIAVAPRLPDHWHRFQLAGLRIGDATVGLAMERDEGVVRWRLRQTAGGAPVTWIFEPRIPLPAVGEVRVDGEAAEVDVAAVARGFSVPVQLPAKRERVVEVLQSST